MNTILLALKTPYIVYRRKYFGEYTGFGLLIVVFLLMTSILDKYFPEGGVLNICIAYVLFNLYCFTLDKALKKQEDRDFKIDSEKEESLNRLVRNYQSLLKHDKKLPEDLRKEELDKINDLSEYLIKKSGRL